ncbi:MAG TPA: hypothetical protein VI229_00215 [Burkholderiales bacterium]
MAKAKKKAKAAKKATRQPSRTKPIKKSRASARQKPAAKSTVETTSAAAITQPPEAARAPEREPEQPESPEITSGDSPKPRAPLPPAAYGLTSSIAAWIEALGAAKGASRAANSPKRITLLAEVERASAGGEPPPPLAITSKTNGSYARHATRLHELAQAGDLVGLKCHELPNGKNTYARALRKYRDALEAWVLKPNASAQGA